MKITRKHVGLRVRITPASPRRLRRILGTPRHPSHLADRDVLVLQVGSGLVVFTDTGILRAWPCDCWRVVEVLPPLDQPATPE